MNAASAGACRVCGNSAGNRELIATERMFGMGGQFAYLECSACGCLELKNPPAEMSRYYPADYHSLRPAEANRRARSKKQLAAEAYFTKLPAEHPPHQPGRHADKILESVAHAVTTREARILDVGCGTGALLLRLQSLGFTRLHGIEPHIERDIVYGRERHAQRLPVRIQRGYLEEAEGGPWDLIMLHHCFEHMPDPAATLHAIAERLAPEGLCLIRVPVAGSWAAKHYRENWVQLDAPRHLFLQTPKSLGLLANAAGLRVRELRFDSTEFQFWGSEMYQRGETLEPAPGTTLWNRLRRRWRRKAAIRLGRMKARAQQLNASGEGDQAAFYLERAQ